MSQLGLGHVFVADGGIVRSFSGISFAEFKLERGFGDTASTFWKVDLCYVLEDGRLSMTLISNHYDCGNDNFSENITIDAFPGTIIDVKNTAHLFINAVVKGVLSKLDHMDF